MHLLADSGCGRYAALLLGTAAIFRNLGGFPETVGAGLGAEWPWVLPGADQADD
jgi:hypothetical protein